MTSKLPDPLVPVHVDLSSYDWMPYYGERLQKSDHNAVGDEEFRASINIWWAAWRSTPAASLPNDDIQLAKAADLGRDLKTWRRVREHAMRNFVLCSDGRYYHTFLAPLAISAYAKKVEQAIKGKAGANKRWANHTPKSKMARPVDNDGSAIDKGKHRHASAMAQPSSTGGTGNAAAIENDSELESCISTTVVDGETRARAVDNPQPPEGKPKSEQRATASPTSAAYEATPQPLRRFLPEHMKPPSEPSGDKS